ncbi:MAG: exosortase/archaeosortase family protein [Longimicrobiales bacterium]
MRGTNANTARLATAWLPWVVATIAYAWLFRDPLAGTARMWWSDADAGHGLLLAPLALILAWRSGKAADASQRPVAGLAILAAAVLMRTVGGLATELYTMRVSALVALIGGVVFMAGFAQVRRWWLPVALLWLSLPLPEIVLSSLALPLQFRASHLGAALLDWRHVPVHLTGNVIQLPGHALFVTEACSGLRSLSALLALGLLMGGLFLRTWWGRIALVALAIPIAMLLNGVRIFLTGFAVFYIDPKLGEGVMHYTEGWFMFVAAMIVLAGAAWLVHLAERGRAEVEAPQLRTGGRIATA